jgi:hypothetical protein
MADAFRVAQTTIGSSKERAGTDKHGLYGTLAPVFGILTSSTVRCVAGSRSMACVAHTLPILKMRGFHWSLLFPFVLFCLRARTTNKPCSLALDIPVSRLTMSSRDHTRRRSTRASLVLMGLRV